MCKSNLYDLVKDAAIHVTSAFNQNGKIEGGHNGPYNDPETPVRNTAHWLFVLSHLSLDSECSEISLVANKLCDYLLSISARPMQASFYCRSNPNKDFCNGLMGQAWAMEGLIAAGKKLKRKDALKLARKVFYLHPWLEKQCIWRRVAVDGSYLTPDGTFNHQLWFAAIASKLDDREATRRALLFLDNVGQHVQLYNDGVVFHQSRLGHLSSIVNHFSIKSFARKGLNEFQRLKTRARLYIKSVGYHGFNLYAFALLKQQFPDHSFWSSNKFKKMLKITTDNNFIQSLKLSKYGWPYNPPGIEFAFVGEVFGLGHTYCQTWITRQFERTYNEMTSELLTSDVPDTLTSAARIYEAIRLIDNYFVPNELAK